MDEKQSYATMITAFTVRAERRHKRRVALIRAKHQAVYDAIARGDTLEGGPLHADAENVIFAMSSWATAR